MSESPKLLRVIENLQDAGCEPRIAEALAMELTVVTKSDLALLEGEVDLLKRNSDQHFRFISSELLGIRKRMEEKINTLREEISSKFYSLERMYSKIDSLQLKIDTKVDSLERGFRSEINQTRSVSK